VAAGVCCCVLLLFLLISLLRHKNKKQQEEEEHEQEEESSQQTSMYTMVDETPIAQDNIYGSTREIRNDVVYENMPSDTDTVTYSTMPQ
jgi:Ca2+/H+ antiporter